MPQYPQLARICLACRSKAYDERQLAVVGIWLLGFLKLEKDLPSQRYVIWKQSKFCQTSTGWTPNPSKILFHKGTISFESVEGYIIAGTQVNFETPSSTGVSNLSVGGSDSVTSILDIEEDYEFNSKYWSDSYVLTCPAGCYSTAVISVQSVSFTIPWEATWLGKILKLQQRSLVQRLDRSSY